MTERVSSVRLAWNEKGVTILRRAWLQGALRSWGYLWTLRPVLTASHTARSGPSWSTFSRNPCGKFSLCWLWIISQSLEVLCTIILKGRSYCRADASWVVPRPPAVHAFASFPCITHSILFWPRLWIDIMIKASWIKWIKVYFCVCSLRERLLRKKNVLA